MNRPLVISSRAEPALRLRAAAPGDLDNLRVWKNANKAGFFFKDEITPDMQKKWFAAYSARSNDFMFVVEKGDLKAGCLGFRILDNGEIDAYNIIASPEAKGKGVMKAAMALLCSYAAARHGRDIGCLVVTGNPAVTYYEHCGFKVMGDAKDHHILKLDWTRFRPVEFVENES